MVFFQLLTWISSGKYVDATEKSALKLVKLPSFKAICWNLMKIQLLKVATFFRPSFPWRRRFFLTGPYKKLKKPWKDLFQECQCDSICYFGYTGPHPANFTVIYLIYRKILKISPSMYKPSKYKTPPQTGDIKNPPLNRSSKYKPPGGLYLENFPQIQSKTKQKR